MKTLDLIQGSPQWLAYRATARNASDVAAMLGCSPYMTRTALLHAMHTGMRAEVDGPTQRRFDDGHAVEAAQRPTAEEIIGEDLYPCVGSEVLSDDPLSTTPGIELSASFDGLTLGEDENWECKSLNEELRAALPNPGPDGNDAANLPKCYRVQMQQQCMVGGCKRVLFTAAALDGSDVRHCWFYPSADLAREILSGWRQFDIDLAAYIPPERAAIVIAEPVQALPTVSVIVDGAITIKENFAAFETAVRDFLEHRLIREPRSDQDFADLDQQIKAMKGAEAALESAEANWIAQIEAVDNAKRTKDMLLKLVSDNREMAEKLLATEKERRRGEIVAGGVSALRRHIDGLNERIGQPFMPSITADFAGAIKGRSNLVKMEEAVDAALANAKIEANAAADCITLNLRTLKAQGEYEFLFADLRSVVTKAAEDFQALVQSRVLAHQAGEKRRAEAAAEKERERIRAEEAARADREAREKVQQEEAQRARLAEPLPIPAIVARESPAPVSQAAAPSVRAANSPSVVPIARGKPTLRLGDINARIAPLAITEAGLQKLGFPAAARERSACLYHAADLPAMIDSAIAHLRMAQQQATEAEAA